MAIPLTSFTGHIEKPDGTAATGSVTFTLSEWVRDASANIVYDDTPVTVTLTAGAFTHDLIVNNHPAADPSTTHYTVTVSADALPARTFDIVIPDVGTLDLSDALLVTPADPFVSYITPAELGVASDDLSVLIAMGGY